MVLKVLDIFKLILKKNCKDCGFLICMVFFMKVVLGVVEVGKCLYMFDDVIVKLLEVIVFLMKVLKVGVGVFEYELGGEIVLFRYEKILVSRNRYVVLFCICMSDEVVDVKIVNMKKVDYVRIGE